MLAAVIFALIPLAGEHLTSAALLAIVAGVLTCVCCPPLLTALVSSPTRVELRSHCGKPADAHRFVVILETIGKLGAVGDDARIDAVLGHEDGSAVASLHRQLGAGFASPDEHPNRAPRTKQRRADAADLTEQEAGEEDAGVEGEVGAVRRVRALIGAEPAGLGRQAPPRAALRLRCAVIVPLEKLNSLYILGSSRLLAHASPPARADPCA